MTRTFFFLHRTMYARKEKKEKDFNNFSFLFCTVFKKFDKIHQNNLRILYFMKHIQFQEGVEGPIRPTYLYH